MVRVDVYIGKEVVKTFDDVMDAVRFITPLTMIPGQDKIYLAIYNDEKIVDVMVW